MAIARQHVGLSTPAGAAWLAAAAPAAQCERQRRPQRAPARHKFPRRKTQHSSSAACNKVQRAQRQLHSGRHFSQQRQQDHLNSQHLSCASDKARKTRCNAWKATHLLDRDLDNLDRLLHRRVHPAAPEAADCGNTEVKSNVHAFVLHWWVHPAGHRSCRVGRASY